MGKGLVASFLGLSLSANLALGQVPQTPSTAQASWRSSPASGRVQTGDAFPTAPADLNQTPANEQNGNQPASISLDSAPPSSLLTTAEADYLLWIYPRRQSSFDAATTKIQSATGLGTLGDERFSRHVRSGGQFGLGWWDTEEDAFPTRTLKTFGAEVRFFFLGERSLQFSNDTAPTIIRPFFDLNNREASGVVVAAPGLATGGIEASARERFWGGEANVWKNLYHDEIPYNLVSVDVMVGFRHFGLEQDLEISRATQFFADLKKFPDFAGFEKNRIQENETFATRNYFYGGQIGAACNLFLDKVVLTGIAKLALGATHEDLTISGYQVRTSAGGAKTVSQGALLALPSNIGTFRQERFAQVPELGLKASCPIFDHVTFTAGCNTLYWSRIARARDQIQRDIDITQIPNFPGGATATPTGFARPGVPFNQSSLWVLGVNFGVEISW